MLTLVTSWGTLRSSLECGERGYHLHWPTTLRSSLRSTMALTSEWSSTVWTSTTTPRTHTHTHTQVCAAVWGCVHDPASSCGSVHQPAGYDGSDGHPWAAIYRGPQLCQVWCGHVISIQCQWLGHVTLLSLTEMPWSSVYLRKKLKIISIQSWARPGRMPNTLCWTGTCTA